MEIISVKSLFTSDRERNLWLSALVVMVAIYATLGPARSIVDALRERNLLRVSFALLVVIVVIVFAWQWLKSRPGWSEIGVAIGIALAYWGTFLRMGNPAERTHLIEYGIVAVLIHMALIERGRNGRPVSRPAALTVVVTALLGLLDEGIQAVLPSRVFDWIDVLFNAFAGFIVIVARLALAPVRLPGWRLWFLWSIVGAIGWGWTMDPSMFGEPRKFEILQAIPSVSVPLYQSVAAGGILVALIQSVLLRRYIPVSLRWILASLGAVAGGALVVIGPGRIDPDTALLAGVGLYGFLAGVLQWLVLRRHVARAGWWVPANILGWIAAIPAGDINGPPGWALYGAITGAVLVFLLRREHDDTSPHS